MKLTTTLRSTIAQDIIDAMAAGSGGEHPRPVIEIYDGTIPAAMGGTINDTLLATVGLNTTPATETDGVITFQAMIEDSSADASGDAGWCRVLDRGGDEVVYFTIADDGSGEINFNTVSIVAGAPVSISSMVVNVGGA
jgi:hypothetical protein